GPGQLKVSRAEPARQPFTDPYQRVRSPRPEWQPCAHRVEDPKHPGIRSGDSPLERRLNDLDAQRGGTRPGELDVCEPRERAGRPVVPGACLVQTRPVDVDGPVAGWIAMPHRAVGAEVALREHPEGQNVTGVEGQA